jgi:hypothetical protein
VIFAVIMFILFSLAAFGSGAILFAAARSAVHEIEALILVLIGALFLVAAGIIEAIFLATRQLVRASEKA